MRRRNCNGSDRNRIWNPWTVFNINGLLVIFSQFWRKKLKNPSMDSFKNLQKVQCRNQILNYSVNCGKFSSLRISTFCWVNWGETTCTSFVSTCVEHSMPPTSLIVLRQGVLSKGQLVINCCTTCARIWKCWLLLKPCKKWFWFLLVFFSYFFRNNPQIGTHRLRHLILMTLLSISPEPSCYCL